jgi:diguanylate cyclase (GGDEF)-like protein
MLSKFPEIALRSKRLRSKLLPSKRSLSWMLTMPFILQVIAVVGWVGYLSYLNGQRSVADLTQQLLTSTGRQVDEKLSHYLAEPLLSNRTISDAVKRGDLDPSQLESDQAQWSQYLWQQMQLFETFSWISLGNEQGDAMGAWRPGEGQPLQLSVSNRSTQYFGTYHATLPPGKLGSVLKIERPAFDPRPRPWYRKAIAAKGPIWTPIYAGFTPGTIFVAASLPLYDPADRLVGVVATDLSLTAIQTFLAKTKVSPASQLFLIERSGLLVSSSSQEAPFRKVGDRPPEQISALESKNELIRTTTQALQRQTDLQQLRQPQSFRFTDHQPRFVKVVPLNGQGLDWLIVIVIPEADVMGQIHQNTLTTIGLCAAAVALAIAVNNRISRHLSRPIIGLSQASQRIAQGDWRPVPVYSRIDELATLAESFQQMSQEIQQSRQQLEDYSASLEQTVNDRTQALQAEIQQRASAERQLQTANRQLQDLAYRDGLTQIANRRYFDQRLAEEWFRLKREQQPIALILCDVDHFKTYNDSYGHQQGDDCLRAVAQAIAQAIKRPPDLVARYGGEEFVIILPNTNLAGAIAVASRVRDEIHQLGLPHRASSVGNQVTMSLGVASQIPSDSTTAEALLEQADQALYQAKQTGRDRVCSQAMTEPAIAEAAIAEPAS